MKTVTTGDTVMSSETRFVSKLSVSSERGRSCLASLSREIALPARLRSYVSHNTHKPIVVVLDKSVRCTCNFLHTAKSNNEERPFDEMFRDMRFGLRLHGCIRSKYARRSVAMGQNALNLTETLKMNIAKTSSKESARGYERAYHLMKF